MLILRLIIEILDREIGVMLILRLIIERLDREIGVMLILRSGVWREKTKMETEKDERD